MKNSVVAIVAACALAAFAANAATPKWISGDSAAPESPAPVLERTFSLDEIPRKAVLSLAVAGWHEVSVNGVRVGDDVLSPVTCQPNLRISSVARDITPYLKKGENAVSVLLGNGWYNNIAKDTWGFCKERWNSSPKVCGELVADGKTLFTTGAGWIAYDSPIVFNSLRNGEWYDARNEGLHVNVRWATVVKYTPYADVSSEDAPPCRAFDPVPPVRSFPADDGGTIYDFGTLRAGWCEIEVVGRAGAKVTIDYDESLSFTNTLLGRISRFAHYGEEQDPNPFQHDEYTLAGRTGGERWHPRFTYHGFRYARVRTEGDVELKSIKSVFVHSALDSAGSLDTSDGVFSRLQDATRRSYLANFVGIPTDCPHREKNGWTGDTQLAMETGLWNFDAKDGYVHFLRMALDTQRRNGQIPCILPCTEKFGYFCGSGPAYDAILFEIPWQIYRFYGDDAPAREAYGAMKKYLGFIATKARDDGLVDYGLGDWSAPFMVKVAPVLLTDSAYVYQFNRRVAFWAERFGEPDVAARCRDAAATVRAAFNREFYRGDGVYADGGLTALAAALYFDGLCADGEDGKVAKRLVEAVRKGGHKAHFGILGAKWVPRVLARHGFIDDAWRIFTQPDEPGWAAWMKENDTLLESFDRDFYKESHVHIMFGDLSAWGYEYAAGIVPLAPGFRKVALRPHPIKGVDSLVATYNTPHGEIRSGWKTVNGKTVIVREVPSGIELANDAHSVAPTFANPLDLEYRMRPETNMNFREGADPDVVMWNDRYWLFASKCGGYFVSDDLAKWTLVRTDDLPLEEYAPSAWVMDGNLYFSSRGGSVHRAVDAAAGKWERVKGKVSNTTDSKLFVEDGRLYDYYGGTSTKVPLWVQELNPATFANIGERVPITEMDDSRFGWDVRGDSNELTSAKSGCKEGSHMIKRSGTYYYQYATPGTQYATYSDVALVGSSPTGPFARQRLNPFSFKPTGYAKGAGHGCTIIDRHGNFWHITTCVVSGINRRIVMLPVFFDPDGEMWCDTAFADWPMAIPDHRTENPQDYHTGWMPLTYGKSVSVSSCAKNSRKESLVDENMRSVWSAATGNAGEWAEVDLGGVAEVRAVQVGFAETGDCAPWREKDAARRWRLEVSEDGKTWKCVVDESGATNAADHPYRVLKAPARAAKVRVVCVGVPAGTTFALREIRVFGRMDMPRPQTPELLAVVRDGTDRRWARVSWKAAEGAEGYVVRYGPAPGKLHLSLMVRDACETEVRALDTAQDYWWTVEAFNAAGFSAAMDVHKE